MKHLTVAIVCLLWFPGATLAHRPDGPIVDDESVDGSTANDCDTSVEPRPPLQGLRLLYTQHADGMGPVTDLNIWSPVDLVLEHSSLPNVYPLVKDTVHKLTLSGHTAVGPVQGSMTGLFGNADIDTTGEFSPLPIPPRLTVIKTSAESLVVRLEFHGRAATFRLSNQNTADPDVGALPVSQGPQDALGSNVLTFIYGASGEKLLIDIKNPNVDFMLAHSSDGGFKKLVPKSVGGHMLVLWSFDNNPRGALYDQTGSEVLAFKLATVGKYDASSNKPIAYLTSNNGSKTGAKLNHALVVTWRGLTTVFEVGGI